MTDTRTLDTLVQQALAALAEPPPEGPRAAFTASMRERFMEVLVLSLAGLYGKTPVPSTPFDRALMKTVTDGMDENEAGKLSLRADDGIRLEGLVRVQEGQKNYTLNRGTLAALSVPAGDGTLGEFMERIAAAYINPGPTPELRAVTRKIGAYVIANLAARG